MLDAIRSRRSVRQFTADPVTDEQLKTLLEACLLAPSAVNLRPWAIIAVRDPDLRAKLAKTHQYAGLCAGAPLVLVVGADGQRSPRWWIDDAAAAMENALLAAEALGLGGCWVGVHAGEGGEDPTREQYVRETLGIPEHIRILGLAAIGTPAQKPEPREAGPWEAVHFDRWGQQA